MALQRIDKPVQNQHGLPPRLGSLPVHTQRPITDSTTINLVTKVSIQIMEEEEFQENNKKIATKGTRSDQKNSIDD